MSRPAWLCSCLLVVSAACNGGEPTSLATSKSAVPDAIWTREWRWTLSGQAPSENDLRQGRTLAPVDGLAAMETIQGEWVHDTVEKGGRTVLRQEAKNSDPVFNVVLTDKVGLDVELEVSLRSIAGEVDQGGGLVWRARDGKNYYIARFNPLEDNYRVYTVVDGARRQLATAKRVVPPDAWCTLNVRMIGDHIECRLDGELMLDVHDGTFTEAGRIGLWTKADANTEFDDLVLRTR